MTFADLSVGETVFLDANTVVYIDANIFVMPGIIHLIVRTAAHEPNVA
jgi:hypothetical protein